MSRFDTEFEFRLAHVDEIDKIMEFNRQYWGKKDHILATNRDFFEYEFCKGDRVGYFLAVDKSTGDIMAAEGVYFYAEDYIPGQSDMSSGMFLANPNCKVPLVGIELMKRKFEQLRPRAFVGPGVNMDTSGPLYQRVLHQDVRRMKHFYILADKKEYKVARIIEKKISASASGKQFALKSIASPDEMYRYFNDEAFRDRKPYKDRWYVTHRYFEHPRYVYKLFVVGEETVIVGREISVNGTKIFRIVDILGKVSNISYLGDAFQNMLQDNSYEYIDLYELGMDDDDILSAGFFERTEDDVNIIPNYFKPYECRNIEIYAQRLDTEVLCFVADGDQDRPN